MEEGAGGGGGEEENAAVGGGRGREGADGGEGEREGIESAAFFIFNHITWPSAVKETLSIMTRSTLFIHRI